MNALAHRFFMTAVVVLCVGMAWGLQMGASQDHSLSPAHAHLNLVGGVLFALAGLFYNAVPQAAASKLAQGHYWIALLGAAIMVPGIAMAHSGGTEALAVVGSFITLAATLLFAVIVWSARS